MGAVKRLFTEIQDALENRDRLTLQYLLHTHVSEDGDRSWIVEGMLSAVGQWLYNDPSDGHEMLFKETDLEQRREFLEPLMFLGGEWYGTDDLTICHDCAHLISNILGVPIDDEEPECDCGRHDAQLTITSTTPLELPVAVEPQRCPCGSLLAVRMFEADITRAVDEGRLSDLGALWYRELNQELGFKGFLRDRSLEDAPSESEVSE